MVPAGHRDGISLVIALGVLDGYNPHKEPQARLASPVGRPPREVPGPEHSARLMPGVVWHTKLASTQEEVVAADSRTPLDLASHRCPVEPRRGCRREVDGPNARA